MLKNVASKSCVLRGLREDNLVVVCDVKQFGNVLSEASAVAAILTTNSDDERGGAVHPGVRVKKVLLGDLLGGIVVAVVFDELVDELDSFWRAASAQMEDADVDETVSEAELI